MHRVLSPYVLFNPTCAGASREALVAGLQLVLFSVLAARLPRKEGTGIAPLGRGQGDQNHIFKGGSTAKMRDVRACWRLQLRGTVVKAAMTWSGWIVDVLSAAMCSRRAVRSELARATATSFWTIVDRPWGVEYPLLSWQRILTQREWVDPSGRLCGPFGRGRMGWWPGVRMPPPDGITSPDAMWKRPELAPELLENRFQNVEVGRSGSRNVPGCFQSQVGGDMCLEVAPPGVGGRCWPGLAEHGIRQPTFLAQKCVQLLG